MISGDEANRYNAYIIECNVNRDKVLLFIYLDCSAFCEGCIFCDTVAPVCTCTRSATRSD